MITRCLICNSSVVLSKDAAKALARLMGTLDGFLRGIQQSPARQQPITSDLHCESPLEHAFNLMLDGICGAAANWNSTAISFATCAASSSWSTTASASVAGRSTTKSPYRAASSILLAEVAPLTRD